MAGYERPVVAITLGDPNGIGPEVVLKALQDPKVCGRARYIVVGSRSVLGEWGDVLDLELPEDVNVVNIDLAGARVHSGKITAAAGNVAMGCVERACDLCLAGDADAMVTAPISKEAIKLAGFDFPGHTEFLAERTKADHVVMMLVSGSLRVALLTIHEPLRNVAGLVTHERILKTLQTLSSSVAKDFGITKPRMAVLGLNPHAGDGGVIGREEIEIIQPAIEKAKTTGLNVSGPFPADGFFGRRGDREFDAVLAMYHDQGLAPFKALAMGAGVNVTCGVPIVRTSPDHGTAFGIAGQGVASADSMKQAILLAADIANRRKASVL